MKKLKVLSIGLLFSCVQLQAAAIERQDSGSSLGSKVNEKVALNALDSAISKSSEGLVAGKFGEYNMGTMARRGCRSCCGKLWTGGVWLVTSAGSLLWGGNTAPDKKKQ